MEFSWVDSTGVSEEHIDSIFSIFSRLLLICFLAWLTVHSEHEGIKFIGNFGRLLPKYMASEVGRPCSSSLPLQERHTQYPVFTEAVNKDNMKLIVSEHTSVGLISKPSCFCSREDDIKQGGDDNLF